MNASRWERWTAYWTECARLLYWAYFKPFTLATHLRRIHPDLEPTSNPFRLRHEFAANPELARYAQQSAHLAQAVPLLAMFLVGGLIHAGWTNL